MFGCAGSRSSTTSDVPNGRCAASRSSSGSASSPIPVTNTTDRATRARSRSHCPRNKVTRAAATPKVVASAAILAACSASGIGPGHDAELPKGSMTFPTNSDIVQ